MRPMVCLSFVPLIGSALLISYSIAGWTYCGIGTLSLLDRLPRADGTPLSKQPTAAADENFVQDILHWLVHLQTITLIDDQEGFEIIDEGPLSVQEVPVHVYQDTPDSMETHSTGLDTAQSPYEASLNVQALLPSHHEPTPSLAQALETPTGPAPLPTPPLESLDVDPEQLLWIGFSGRCNKFADTCYAFWAGGTLGVSIHRILGSEMFAEPS